jgi:capsular polysaccharide transport system ATP-binding protein
MIRLHNVSKTFYLNGRKKTVAQNMSATFPTGSSVAILGRNGAGKSTLLRMIGGILQPDYGHIFSTGSISFPVGFMGSFHPDLTGLQNTRFVGRIYGVDTDELCAFVSDFAELGTHFELPVRSYSSGMRSRLAFGVSMGIQFDTYLIDEVTSVGDATFRERCSAVLAERTRDAGVLVVSHSMPMCRRLCTSGAVLENGKLVYYEDLDEAIAQHEENLAAA